MVHQMVIAKRDMYDVLNFSNIITIYKTKSNKCHSLTLAVALYVADNYDETQSHCQQRFMTSIALSPGNVTRELAHAESSYRMR